MITGIYIEQVLLHPKLLCIAFLYIFIYDIERLTSVCHAGC